MRIRILLFGALVLMACAPRTPEDATADALPESMLLSDRQAHGQVLYDGLCWGCHGSGGHGDGPATSDEDTPPPTFHTRDFSTAEASQIGARFRAGIIHSETPDDHPHARYVMGVLRTEYLDDVLEYVRILSYPPEIPGSALAGATTYSLRCVSCHGEAGDGMGPLADHYVDAGVADLTTNPLIRSKDWDQLYARLSEGTLPMHGTKMVAWGEILTASEIWDLVAYVATFQPQTVSASPWGEP